MAAETPTPFVLTPRLVAEKALPLLVAGKLGGQLHPNNKPGVQCFYRHPLDGSPCVIGAALPDHLVKRIGNMSPVSDASLFAAEIECADEDLETLMNWQLLHDNGEFDELHIALEAELAKPVEA